MAFDSLMSSPLLAALLAPSREDPAWVRDVNCCAAYSWQAQRMLAAVSTVISKVTGSCRVRRFSSARRSGLMTCPAGPVAPPRSAAPFGGVSLPGSGSPDPRPIGPPPPHRSPAPTHNPRRTVYQSLALSLP